MRSPFARKFQGIGSGMHGGDEGSSVPPVLLSAQVTDANPDRIILTFNKPITSLDFAVGLTVEIDAVGVTALAEITPSPASVVTLDFDELVLFGEVVTVSYVEITGDYVDADTTAVEDFTDEAVTNNVTAPAVPDIFEVGMWSVADLATNGDLRVTISSLPAANKATITDIEYRQDGGSWTSLSTTTTGAHTISGLTNTTSYDYELRCVNAVGNAGPSDLKAVTPTATTAVPSTFILGDWTLTNPATTGDLEINIDRKSVV